MDYSNFENTLIEYLINDKKKECLDLITINEALINEYLGETEDNSYKKGIVEKFNELIDSDKCNLKLIELVLKHELFQYVYSEFKESDVLIQTSIHENRKAVKWLLTMGINLSITDENGMTALMHAVKSPKLLFFPRNFLITYNYDYCLPLTDNNGETALFHALDNSEALLLLFSLREGRRIDINHLNKDHENIFIKCCKNDKLDAARLIANQRDNDFNILDSDGYTGLMYLIEKGCYNEISAVNGNVDINFENERHESALKLLLKKIDETRNSIHPNYIKPYIHILKRFISKKYDFNVTIDDEENTPLMYFIMIEDFCTVYYMVSNCDIDLSMKNKNNDDALTLAMKLNNNYLKDLILFNKNYKLDYLDKYNNNLLMFYCIRNDAGVVRYIISKNKDIMEQLNDRGENALIISTKLGHRDIVPLLLMNGTEVDVQDYLGNTALYYAVDIQDDYLVNALIYYKADPNIKNRKGKSPLELAKDLQDDNILNAMQNPVKPYLYKRREQEKDSLSSNNNKTSSKNNNNTKDKNPVNDYSSINLHNVSLSKYKNVVDFYIQKEKENKYTPFPQNDVIRNIEYSIYGFDPKDNSASKVVGLSKDKLYELIILQALAIMGTFAIGIL